MTGAILWSGRSRFDGRPVILIGTDGSANRKTGPMSQTWILGQHEPPHNAVRAGTDGSICGTCVMRAGNGCYVNTAHAPLSVWRAWKRGKYPTMRPATWAAGRIVRIGAYGDPAAVPVSVWRRMLRGAAGHTGYTHAWRDPRFSGLRDFCMASVETDAGARAAAASGWGTFRVLKPGETVSRLETICPAHGGGTTCADCLACDGSGAIVIPGHGSRVSRIPGWGKS